MTSGGGTGGQADQLYIDITARLDGFEQRLDQAEQLAQESGERTGSKFSGALSLGLGIATAGALALAGGLAAVATSSVNLAQESAQNVNEFQAKLGASREEAERLGSVAEQVFGDNWTGNLTEAGAAVANVRRQLKDLTDDELAKVTGGTVAIAETFEEEQDRVAQAVKSVMENTGASAQEALDIITKGFQDGLNGSGDFIDSILEYGPQFKKAQLSGEELFSVLKTGYSEGALGTDKVSDALKEFMLRAVDGADATKEAYGSLGLDYAKLETQLRAGQITYGELFQTVISKLRDVKSEAERNDIAAALFGGAGEDLTGKGLAQIDLTKTKLKDLGGATDSLNAKYNSLGQFLEGMWRRVQLALLPVGKELLSIANEAAPFLQKALEGAAAKLPGMITSGIEAAKAFGATAVNVYNTVRPAIDAVVTGAKTLSTWLEKNKEVMIPLAAGVTAAAAAFGAYRVGVAAVTLATTLWTAAQTAAAAASVALRAALTFITGPIGIAVTVIGLLVAAGVYLYRNWDEVKAKALAIWAQVKETVVNAIQGAVNFLRNLDLKELAIKALLAYVNGVKSVVGLVVQAATTVGSAILDVLKKIPGQMIHLASEMVAGLVNGIKNGVGAVGEAARNLATGVVSSVKSALRIQSPSRVMQELGQFTAEGFVKGIESGQPSVKAAAEGTAASFLSAFKDLQLEREVGKVDLSTYTRTLTDAAATLRGKLATVKEGTPAYSAWLSALQQVTKELDNLRGKTSAAQQGAKGHAAQLSKNRAALEADISMEKWVAGLRSATTAQLQHAQAVARGQGDAERFNAIQSELARRQDVATAATGRATEAARREREERSNNRAQIQAGEAMERYVKGLRSATDAQLASALATARTNGETDRYNAIKAEQQRRTDAATAATERATDAARREREERSNNRAQIEAGETQERYVKGLRSATDAQLASALATARSNGETDRYNAIKAEQQRRTDATTAATERATDAARREREERSNNRTQIEAGEAMERYVKGLRSATDAQLASALAVAREGGEVEKYNAIKAEQQRRTDAATAAQERETAASRRAAETAKQGRQAIAEGREYATWKEGLRDLTDQELRSAAATLEAAGNQQRYNDVVSEQQRRVNEASQAQERWTDNLDRLKEAGWVKSLRDLDDGQLAAALSAAEASKNVSQYNAVLAEQGRRTEDTARKQEAWTTNLNQIKDSGWVKSLRDLDDGQLAAALSAAEASRNVSQYNAVLAEQGRRTDETAKGQQAWADNLDRIQQGTWTKSLRDMTDAQLAAALASAEAGQNVTEYNAVLGEQVRRTEEVTKKSEAWADNLVKLSEGNWVKGVREMTDEQLLSALATAEASQNVSQYNAVLTEMLRRVDDAGKVQEAWFDNLDKVADGEWVQGLRSLDDGQLQAALSAAVAAQNVEQYNAVLAELKRRSDEAASSQSAWSDNLNRINFASWTAGLKNMSDAELAEMLSLAAASRNVAEYNAVLAEQGRRVDDSTKRHEAWVANLEKIEQGTWVDSLRNLSDEELQSALSAATAAEDLDQFNAVLAEMKRRTDDSAKAQAAWQGNLDRIERAGWVEGLKGLSDAQLVLALETASSTQNVEDFNAILAEQQRRSDEVTKNTDTLSAARQKLTEVLRGGAAPYAAEIASLEALRGKPGVVAQELDGLIASYIHLQAEAQKRDQLEKTINTWAGYAKQLIPVVVAGIEALGGASSEVAEQWSSDMSSMVNDLVSFGTAIARGDWVGAVVQVLTTIFGWWNRNKRAAEEAARAAKEYNQQFMFSQNGYGTRQVEQYSTGFLFWQTDHYKETIDEAGKTWALALERGSINGITDGFTQALAQNDFSLFGKSLTTNIGKAVLEGLVDGFMKGEAVAKLLGPAIQESLAAYASGDPARIATANANLKDATAGVNKLAEQFYNDVLRPVAEEFGLLGTGVQQGPTAPPSGSIAATQAQISNLQQQLQVATTQAERDRLRGEIETLQAELKRMEGEVEQKEPVDAPTPAQASLPTVSRVEVTMPSITSSINFDVFATLSNSVLKLAQVLPASAQGFLEASGRQLTAVDRLERLLTRTEIDWASARP